MVIDNGKLNYLIIPHILLLSRSRYSKMDQVKFMGDKFFKGCLLQILLGPFLKTLTRFIRVIACEINYKIRGIPKIFPFLRRPTSKNIANTKIRRQYWFYLYSI